MSVTGYLQNEETIAQRRNDLVTMVPAIPVDDPALLQMKVDSLNRAHTTMTKSLRALDSLLAGSDRISKFLDRLTTATGNGSRRFGLRERSAWGVQCEDSRVRREAGAELRILLAKWMETISKLRSDDVRRPREAKLRIYSFEMSAPIPADMPDVVSSSFSERAINNDDFL